MRRTLAQKIKKILTDEHIASLIAERQQKKDRSNKYQRERKKAILEGTWTPRTYYTHGPIEPKK
jgi:adenylate kinase family enzyme